MRTFRNRGSALEDMERQSFMRKARDLLLQRAAGGGSGYTPGPTAGRFGMMSKSLPSAAESMAFQEKKKNRALYGEYGKGGLERENLDFAREKQADEVTLERAEFANRVKVQREANLGGLGTQRSRNTGDIAERNLMETGQTDRLERQLTDNRETNMLRFGKGGLEDRKLGILANKSGLPKVVKLQRPDMRGEDAFVPRQNPETGAWELQKLTQADTSLPAGSPPKGITPEQEKKKKKMFDAMSPEQQQYWSDFVN